MASVAFRAHQIAGFVAPRVPSAVLSAVGRWAGRMAAHQDPRTRMLVGRHMRRVAGTSLGGADLDAAIDAVFEGYARYYVDTLRLPGLTPAQVDEGFTVEGFHNIADSVAAGSGTILVLPHLGGWEWAGYWLATTPRYHVSAVVEPLEDQDLMDWFFDLRQSIGLNIIALGSGAAGAVNRALRSNGIVCLLADRDVGGSSVEVDFFGERTRLPAGPATLALRTGATLVPVGVYHQGSTTHAVVRAAVPAERRGRLRDDVTRITQVLTTELEGLIAAAPEQWHLLQPNWPSDHRALDSFDAAS